MNSSRLKPAWSRMDRRVPRGMSLPCGTITKRILPAASRLTNARWLPLPRSGASTNPPLRNALMIAREESDGSRITQRRFQGVWCSGVWMRGWAQHWPAVPGAWHWTYTTPPPLPAQPWPSPAWSRTRPPQAQDIWTRTVGLLSRSLPSSNIVSSSHVEYSRKPLLRQTASAVMVHHCLQQLTSVSKMISGLIRSLGGTHHEP